MSFVWVKKGAESGDLYLTAVELLPNGDVYKIFKYDGDILDEIYSGAEPGFAYEVNGGIYICIGQKIYRHQNKQLVLWKDFTKTLHVGGLYVRTEKDIFTLGKDGRIMHYNGTDLQTLYETHMTVFDIDVFEEDVFILCYGNSPVVIHGKL